MLKELKRIYKVFVSASERFYWENLFSKAASLAYTTILSLVPVAFVGFGFLSSFALSMQELTKVREFIFNQFIPNQSTVNAILQKLAEIDEVIHSSGFSAVAISFFAVTALLLINAIEYALNEIWQVFEQREISRRIGIFSALLVVGPLLIITAYYTVQIKLAPYLLGLEVLASVSFAFNYVISLLIDLFAFFILYYFIPNAPVRATSALFGAITTSILFGLAKYVFTIYIISFSSYDKLYGAIAVIPIFLLWIYIAWSIILFGAEISYQYQNLTHDKKIFRKQVTTIGSASFVIAVEVLIIIAKSFQIGAHAPNEFEISDTIGCSSVVLHPIIVKLKKGNLIAQGDSREMPLMLLKSPQKISIKEIAVSLDLLGQSDFNISSFAGIAKAMGSLAIEEDRSLADLL